MTHARNLAAQLRQAEADAEEHDLPDDLQECLRERREAVEEQIDADATDDSERTDEVGALFDREADR